MIVACASRDTNVQEKIDETNALFEVSCIGAQNFMEKRVASVVRRERVGASSHKSLNLEMSLVYVAKYPEENRTYQVYIVIFLTYEM